MKVLFFAKRFSFTYVYENVIYNRIVSLEAFMDGRTPRVTLSWYVDVTDNEYENNNYLTYLMPERKETFPYPSFYRNAEKLLGESLEWINKVVDKKVVEKEEMRKLFTECQTRCETKCT